ncbi:MAG: hypothetical protein JO322_14295 [Candidatus Eremiobacteraeota bacterium]|nr:hypothetical protein [Candidatus Eremiobacteraeota bacterium]
MNWEALTAIGTLLSAVVIAASAILALRQVTQLRRAAQLDGTMRIFAQFSDPDFIAARNFVLSDLQHKLKDPPFVEELRSYTNVDFTRHPEYRVMMFLQIVGCLVKNRLVDGPGIYEFAQYSIVKSWERLEPIVSLQRETMNNPFMWGTADYLYESTKRWVDDESRKRGLIDKKTGEPYHAERFT